MSILIRLTNCWSEFVLSALNAQSQIVDEARFGHVSESIGSAKNTVPINNIVAAGMEKQLRDIIVIKIQ